MKVKLGGYIQEYSVRNKANEDIPVYSVTNTQGFCQDYFGKEVASKDKSTYKIVPRGYFAYNPSRINVGSVDWQRDEDQVIVSPLYNVFSVSPELNQQYLYYYLKSDFALHRIKAVATGSVRDNLKLEMLKNFPIRIPSVEEQEFIVQALDKAKNIIDLRRNELQKFDDLIRARFIELFGTIHDNRFGFSVVTLQDVSAPIKDGTHQTPTYTTDVENGYKFLSSKDVTTGKVDWSHLKYIPEELHRELYARISPRKGDLLLAKNGTTGIAAIVDRDEVFDIYVSLALIRPQGVDTTYLWAAINAAETKQQFDASLKGIGVPNLHLGEIKKARIILPPMELQEQFAAFVEQTDKSKLLSGCRLFHSWAPENRDKPKHVGVPRRRTKDLRGVRRQHAPHGPAGFSCNKS